MLALHFTSLIFRFNSMGCFWIVSRIGHEEKQFISGDNVPMLDLFFLPLDSYEMVKMSNYLFLNPLQMLVEGVFGDDFLFTIAAE